MVRIVGDKSCTKIQRSETGLQELYHPNKENGCYNRILNYATDAETVKLLPIIALWSI